VCRRVAIGGFVAVAVVVAVAALRLLSGPIELDFLKARIADAVDAQGGKLKVDADRIFVEWSSLRRPIRLVFSGLHVVDSEKKEVATAPSVALSFSPRSILEGRLFPTSIVVQRPTLNADIAREGGAFSRIMAQTDSKSQGEVVALLIEQLLAEPNYHSLLGQLDTVLVEHAHVTLRDLPSGAAWEAADALASLRRDASGVIIDAKASFTRGEKGDPIALSLSATYSRDRSHISAEASLDGVKPLMFADLSPDLALLAGIDIALRARLKIEASGTGEIRTVRMEVTAGHGTISLPGIFPAKHEVHSVDAVALVDTGAHTARIEQIDVDLGAAKVSIVGMGTRTEKGQTFTGRADMRRVPVDRLADYWPIGMAPGGRAWALENVSNGTVDIGADLSLSGPDRDFSHTSVDRAVASLDYRGLKVRYMPHMPELEGVSGKARYEGNTMHFDIAGGTAVGLAVAGATIDLTNLDDTAGVQVANVHVPISGKAAAAMALLARPKLGLPKDALFDPKRIGGDAAVVLDLRFPLLADLSVNDLEIRADAALSGFALKNALGEVDLTDGAVKVLYADNQLNIGGRAKLDGSPADITIREMFGAKAPFRQRYDLKGTFPVSLIEKAGFFSPEPFVVGQIGTTLTYQTQANGTGDINTKLDLQAAKIAVPQIGWSKAAGAEGALTLGLKFAGPRILSATFDGRAAGLVAKGQVGFGDKASLQQVSLQQFALGRTDLTGDWRRTPSGVDIFLKGHSLELAKVREAIKDRDAAAVRQPNGPTAQSQDITRLSLQLDEVLAQRGSLGSLNGRLEMKGDRIAFANLAIGAGKGSAFKVAPAGTGRTVALFIPDFGQFLGAAGWLDGLVGGDLNFLGQFDDSTSASKLSGTIKIGPYNLQKVTPRADIGSLNSAIEGLDRAGNALQQFDSLEAKVVKTGDRIEVSDGRTSGKSIGLTTAGWVDLAKNSARLRGVVVPGFALNNLISNVPLLGPLLTGGKDGGLFAISYELAGPLDDLKTDVNLMSAVTPNALRQLFSRLPDGAPVEEKERVNP
jgi:hypothetical protein